MAEENIFLKSKSLQLEALAEIKQGENAIIMCHPHPLYGGNMYNPVVEAVIEAYNLKGYSTLRFNFRGVGSSEGEYGNGIDEQQDVLSAIKYLTSLGKTDIDLGGYSFGAWVCASGLKNWQQVKSLLMVSPPVAAMSFNFLSFDHRIKLIIGADGDDIGPVNMISEMLKIWNPKVLFKIISNSDHFYSGKKAEIRRIIEDFLSNK
jgi:uncharacterized protein